MSKIKTNIQSLIKKFSIETTPFSADKISDFRTILRPNTAVYVTFLPGTDLGETLRISKRLKEENLKPIPHFAARSIPNSAFLDDSLNRLSGEVGTDEVLCIAGAIQKPIGDFSNSMELIETELFSKHGIKRIGVAGHPEGSPDITDEEISTALEWKNHIHSTTDANFHIVTQFCFNTQRIIQWDQKIRKTGNILPITIGVPGIANLKTLIKYAHACGVGQSINFLKSQAKNVTNLLRLSTPSKQILEIANYQSSNPESGITGIHIYPLGGIQKSAEWVYKVIDGHFELNDKESSFIVCGDQK